MNNSRLEDMLKSGQKINLGNLFDYLQGIAEGLASIVRWVAREKIAGQSVRENDLQHSYKMPFLASICAVVENEGRTDEDKLDIGLLISMALLHDVGEIIEDDTALFEKVEMGDEPSLNELNSFKRIIAPLPAEVQEYLLQTFQHTIKKNILLNKETRFFNAMENLEYLKRALHECRLGNLHFAPSCIDWHIAKLQEYSEEFPSLKTWYESYVEEANGYLEEFRRRRQEYLAEFVRRGGDEKDFPF